MITFARLQRTMLTAGGVCVPFHRAVVLTFAANVMSVTLPAGPAVSTSYAYKHMRQWGADAPLVTFSLVASGPPAQPGKDPRVALIAYAAGMAASSVPGSWSGTPMPG